MGRGSPAIKATAAQPQSDAKVSVKVDVAELLIDIFDQLDKNGDGFISRDELSVSLDHVLECSHVESQKGFRTLLAESRLNPYLNTFEQLDTNNDGKISKDEFLANMHPSKAAQTVEQKLKGVFDRIDTNRDGSLSREELCKAFQGLLECSCMKSQKNFRTLMVDAGLNPDFYVFEQLDDNQDGKVTWEELRAKLQPAFDFREFLRSVFIKMDADGDGTVSKQEVAESIERMLDCSDMKSKKSLRTLLQEAGLNTECFVFEQLDTNQDGRITWEEFEASLKPMAAQSQAEEPSIEEPAVTDQGDLHFGEEAVVVEDIESGSVTCLCAGWR